jgi:dinuclear metal center YbgI/SA1388 family protein
MKIQQIIAALEEFAPLPYQESYDNCGVQVGNVQNEARAALLCLDITEAVIDEAISQGCNLIIAHHPLIFSGIKKIAGRNYVERVIIKAIKHDLVLYAAHTNLDNMQWGVNGKIAQKLDLQNTQILAPAANKLYKLYSYIPLTHADSVQQALFNIGAGAVGNYSECSYATIGKGTFKPGTATNPAIGTANGPRETVEEVKMEWLIPEHLKRTAINTLQNNHPYEEVAYELIALENHNTTIGAGMIGHLKEALSIPDFLAFVKSQLKAVQKIAICGGSGSFLLPNAMQQNADVFLTSDYKYHQFFDAEQKIIITDIGHYETEQFTIEIFSEILNKKFPNFATLFTKVNTNPVNYYY